MALAGILGALAVGFGAFGAHGWKSKLASVDDGAQRLAWWDTASHYHLTHALALAVVAVVLSRHRDRWLMVSAVALVVGVVLFCGILYAMTLGAPRWFGAITPLGGLGFIVGWVPWPTRVGACGADGRGEAQRGARARPHRGRRGGAYAGPL